MNSIEFPDPRAISSSTNYINFALIFDQVIDCGFPYVTFVKIVSAESNMLCNRQERHVETMRAVTVFHTLS